jgi:hypothetical protein
VNNVNQAAFIQDDKVRSFEQALQRVRDMHEKAKTMPQVISENIESSDSSIPLNKAGSAQADEV